MEPSKRISEAVKLTVEKVNAVGAHLESEELIIYLNMVSDITRKAAAKQEAMIQARIRNYHKAFKNSS